MRGKLKPVQTHRCSLKHTHMHIHTQRHTHTHLRAEVSVTVIGSDAANIRFCHLTRLQQELSGQLHQLVQLNHKRRTRVEETNLTSVGAHGQAKNHMSTHKQWGEVHSFTCGQSL